MAQAKMLPLGMAVPIMPRTEITRPDAALLEEILASVPSEARNLLALLQKVQAQFRYLHEEALKVIAARLDLPLSRVFSLAAFYQSLSLKPKGEKVVKVCCGTACHLRGAPDLISALENELGLELGQTSPDLSFTLEAVNCLGAFALAPVMTMDEIGRGEKTFGEQTPASALKNVRKSRSADSK